MMAYRQCTVEMYLLYSGDILRVLDKKTQSLIALTVWGPFCHQANGLSTSTYVHLLTSQPLESQGPATVRGKRYGIKEKRNGKTRHAQGDVAEYRTLYFYHLFSVYVSFCVCRSFAQVLRICMHGM